MFTHRCGFIILQLAFAAFAFAQEPDSPVVKRSEEHKKGLAMLEEAEREAETLPLEPQVGLLLKVAEVYKQAQSSRAAAVVEKAWQASTATEVENDVRTRLTTEVLRRAYEFAPHQVEPWWEAAAPDVRAATVDVVVKYRTREHDNAGAFDAIQKATTDRSFPYASAGDVMRLLTDELAPKRQELFSAAMAFARTHESPVPYPSTSGSRNDFASFLLRTDTDIPSKQILEAAELVLAQAKAADARSRFSASLSNGQSQVSFPSAYEYRVFQLLPLLRKHSPSRAEELLQQLPSVRENDRANPQGLPAFTGDRPEGVLTLSSSGGSAGTRNFTMNTLPGPDRQEQIRRSQAARESINANPNEALDQAKGLPAVGSNGASSPRLERLTQIAGFTLRTAPGTSALAIDEMLKTVTELKPEAQMRYLRGALRFANELKDDTRLLATVDLGLKTAALLYAADTDSDDPNKEPRAMWPSTAAWQSMLTTKLQTARLAVDDDLRAIEDPEVRLNVKVALARTYFSGIPIVAPWRVQKRHTSANGIF